MLMHNGRFRIAFSHLLGGLKFLFYLKTEDLYPRLVVDFHGNSRSLKPRFYVSNLQYVREQRRALLLY